MNLDARELGAVLAGLRLLQRTTLVPNLVDPTEHALAIWDILTDGDTIRELENCEIDALCERLNRNQSLDLAETKKEP